MNNGRQLRKRQRLNLVKVEERMAELDLRRSDVADALGVNLSTLWRHLGGRHPSSLMFIAGLAEVLEVTVREITEPSEVLCSHCQAAIESKTA